MHHRTSGLTLGLLLAAVFTAAHAQPSELGTALIEYGRFSDKDLKTVDSNPVVKEVSVDEKRREVAMLGAIRVKVPEQFFRKQIKNLLIFSSDTAVKQSGPFSTPPKPQDMASLALPQSDLEDLRKCKLGDCKVKLPAMEIERFQTLDWSASDIAERVTQILRESAAAYVPGLSATRQRRLGSLRRQTKPAIGGRGIPETAGSATVTQAVLSGRSTLSKGLSAISARRRQRFRLLVAGRTGTQADGHDQSCQDLSSYPKARIRGRS